jgi:hypothetical protein
VLFAATAPAFDGDLERLLCRTATELGAHPRLVPLVATWLSVYGHAVARHRLSAFVKALSFDAAATLAFLLEEAVALGGPSELREVTKRVAVLAQPRPLLDIHRVDGALHALAERTASPTSRRWGVWHPPIQARPDAVRPASWVNARVSGLHERLLRRGDLRASIVAALRHDFAGEAASERAIVEGVGATRLAVRRALAALAIEAAVEIDSRGANRLGHRVRLIATHRAA